MFYSQSQAIKCLWLFWKSYVKKNSCYHSWICGQLLFCFKKHSNEAWWVATMRNDVVASFACEIANSCNNRNYNRDRALRVRIFLMFFLIWFRLTVLRTEMANMYPYYINTNEIAQKHDIFTREHNMLSSHVKRSSLLWLHNKSRFCNDLVFHWCLYNKQNITWPLGDTKFLFSCWKIFHSFAHIFNTRREISYLRAVM